MPAAPCSFLPRMRAPLRIDPLIALPISSNMSPSEVPDGVHDEDDEEEEEEEDEEDDVERRKSCLFFSFSLSCLSDPQTRMNVKEMKKGGQHRLRVHHRLPRRRHRLTLLLVRFHHLRVRVSLIYFSEGFSW